MAAAVRFNNLTTVAAVAIAASINSAAVIISSGIAADAAVTCEIGMYHHYVVIAAVCYGPGAM